MLMKWTDEFGFNSGIMKAMRGAVCLVWVGVAAARAEVTALFPFEGKPVLESLTPAISSNGTVTISNRVRVGFYNIEMFTDGIKDGKNRSEEKSQRQAQGAARIIEEFHPDILFVSEIENRRTLGSLNSCLGVPFPLAYIAEFGSESGRNEKMNIALLTRVAPVSVTEIDFGPLKGQGRPTRGVVRAEFEMGEKHSLLAYAVHLKANWGDRERNYAQRVNAMSIVRDDVRAWSEARPDRTWEMLVVGDMNTDPMMVDLKDDPTLKVLEDWIDLWGEHLDISDMHTIPTRYGDPMREFPAALFDRFLVHPELHNKPWHVSLPSVIMKGTETRDITVLPGEGDHVSDHYPVYVDILK